MPDKPHTLSDFEEALKDVRSSLLLMASTTSENLKNSVEGLLSRDTGLCNQAIADDEVVNGYERNIDEKGMVILLRFNPVATDLRVVAATMKIATNLERISDQAENIARRARKILKHHESVDSAPVRHLYELSFGLLRDAIEAYADGNSDLALSLYEREELLDKEHRDLIKELTKKMESDVDHLRTYLNLIFIVRCLERVGDHAVNIAEDVVYIAKGENIRHVGPSGLD
ncbi:MAG: phosphate transport system regulatory protein PhoU [Verrucomicrobiales bacterium]|nr:phosphate transport system regulatory protein PhoU [Verrucomicrobiales bacterium]